jgi:Tfp pilus assembly protein FimT
VEVLTAASLLGVVTVIAASNFRAQIPAYRARGAALLIAGDINQARLNAVKRGIRYYYVPGEDQSYSIAFDDGLGGTETLKEVDVAAEFEGVTFATEAATDPYGQADPEAVPAATITFHSNGTVQNPAGVFLQSEMDDGTTVQQAVTVTAAGRVRVWRFNGSEWF